MSACDARQTPSQKRRRFYTTLGRIERQRKIGDAHGSAVRAQRSPGTLIRPRLVWLPSPSLGTIKSVATDSGQSTFRDALLVGPPRKRTMVHTITPTTDDTHSSNTDSYASNFRRPLEDRSKKKPTHPFTLVHYVRNLEVNEKTTGRDSGNAARSLRSLRSTGVAILRAWNLSILYLPSWNEGNDVNDRVKPLRMLAVLLVHFCPKTNVNDVNGGGAPDV